MRPSYYLLIIIIFTIIIDSFLSAALVQKRRVFSNNQQVLGNVVKTFGLSDLAISTEARYTRHPALSDTVVPFMDHPMALEHFPSGSFFSPVQ